MNSVLNGFSVGCDSDFVSFIKPAGRATYCNSYEIVVLIILIIMMPPPPLSPPHHL